jgi:hypothetical protein
MCQQNSFARRTLVGVRDLTAGEKLPFYAFDDFAGCSNSNWVPRRVSLIPDHVYELTLEIVVIVAYTPNFTLFDDFRLVPAQNRIKNGGFESGLSSWTGTAGTHTLTNDAHTGNFAALVGASPGDSTIVQSLRVTPGYRILSFWYNVDCHGPGDYATVTLFGTDEFGNQNVTKELLPQTCTTGEGWQQFLTTTLPMGTWKLQLTSHDEGAAATPSSAAFDDIEVP